MAGRLQGKAQRRGMQLRLPRPDGGVDVGSEALVRLSVEEVRDPLMVSRSIGDLMEFRRGKLPFPEYAIEWDIRGEATARAGLEINDVGKFYLFFRNSGLPNKFVEDVKLQLQGEIRRFQEAHALALRLVNRQHEGNRFFEYDEDGWREDWNDAYWADEDWTWDHEEYYDDSREDYNDSYEYGQRYGEEDEDCEDWYSPEKEGYEGESSNAAASGTSDKAPASQNENFPTKGMGCSTLAHCSFMSRLRWQARWEQGQDLWLERLRRLRQGHGKSKKGYGTSSGKSQGKDKYGWSPRKGYSNPSKGKGKGHYGCSEKTLTRSFGEGKPLSTPLKAPPKTVHFRMDSDDGPVITLGRSRPSEEAAEDVPGDDDQPTQASASSTSSAAKCLDFSFANSVYWSLSAITRFWARHDVGCLWILEPRLG